MLLPESLHTRPIISSRPWASQAHVQICHNDVQSTCDINLFNLQSSGYIPASKITQAIIDKNVF